jgi:hypothetical protein
MIRFRPEISILRAFLVAFLLFPFWPSWHAGARAADEPRAFHVEGDVLGLHDRAIIKEGDTWYLFTTTPPDSLLTNKTLNPQSPDYHWADEGLVLQSRAEDDFNAIDANLLNEKERAWLSFSGFWSRIKMRKLDRRTGKLSAEDRKIYSLTTRGRPEHFDPLKPGCRPTTRPSRRPLLFTTVATTISLFRTTSVAAGQEQLTEQWWDALAKSQAATWMQKERR